MYIQTRSNKRRSREKLLTATKKELREFITERNHTAHYQGKSHTMYVRGKNPAGIIEQLEKQYPHRHIHVKVDTGIRELHPIANK